MQLTFFNAYTILEPTVETYFDREAFIIAVVRIARTKPSRFLYCGEGYGLVEFIFGRESPTTKVKRIKGD